MKKVLLAVGHMGLEQYIKEALLETDDEEKEENLGTDKFEFVGESVHRENIINLINETSPDILLIRETLPGKTNILKLVYAIRSRFANVRIIFLAGDRKVGDSLLSSLVGYGIYDILHGGNLLAEDIVELIQKPNSYQDVKHLQPTPGDIDELLGDMEFLFSDEETRLMEEEKKRHKEEGIEKNEDEDSIGDIEFEIDNDVSSQTFDSLEKARRKILEEENTEEKPEEEVEIVKPKLKQKSNSKINKVETEKKKINIPKIEIPTITIPKPTISNPFSFKRERYVEEEKLISQPTKNEKIITFWGTKGGIGTSSIAHNMAVSLAEEGNRVIYVELNNLKPSVAYWYDLGHLSEGIDTFAKYLEIKEYKHIKDTIIRTRDLKEINNDYKVFPDTLDFLFFSKEYLVGSKTRDFNSDLKDLYMYLLYQDGYDFVILDVPNTIEKKELSDILLFSSVVFIVVSQDISSLGYHMLDLDNLNKDGIKIKEKSHYIVNKYIDSELGISDIKKWLEVDMLTSITNDREVYINASLNAEPLITRKKDGEELKSKLNKLKKII